MSTTLWVMMMDDATTTLCLSEHQFGYVVLQGPSSEMMDHDQGAVFSAMDGDIPEYGYVKVAAGVTKYNGCAATSPDGLKRIKTPMTTDMGDDVTAVYPTDNKVGVWTIIQDTGDGFFGTEVPTATISSSAARSQSGPTLMVILMRPEQERMPRASCWMPKSPAIHFPGLTLSI